MSASWFFFNKKKDLKRYNCSSILQYSFLKKKKEKSYSICQKGLKYSVCIIYDIYIIPLYLLRYRCSRTKFLIIFENKFYFLIALKNYFLHQKYSWEVLKYIFKNLKYSWQILYLFPKYSWKFDKYILKTLNVFNNP